ncbi:extracellular solute-binding protein [Paenibacillus contaminans]|uniref:ABC transporter substrate-binding protein n=1 Tax=Paenibacillus contaminans TaxID=450362 RepID=A0A329LK06_9BACL|nr:extracellular solute-binding protein [Paenibacillus contaminans]RAV08304.1 ABC transporter substrate-binding protein [Paenibacillus contaminans]
MKRLVSGILAVSLTGVLAACSSDNSKKPAESAAAGTNTNSNTSPSTPAAENKNKKLTITSIAGTWFSPVPSPDGEGVKKINEKFNIDFKPQFVPYDEYENKLPVVMAAGDMPDMVDMESANANFVKWAKQGAFLPLNDYINKYETLKAVPKYVWDAVTVDGKIYAIPQYFPLKYGKKPIIRKDWLDNLGLKMPTNYDELKQVAIAFTKNDPDKNGKDDTYGIGMAKDMVYGAWMNVETDLAWYHKNDQGQLIPGNISNGYKKQIQLLADLYKEGAIHKDWAVSKIADVRKDFFAGKSGIFYEQPYDFSESRFKSLKELQPTADIVVIPPFKQDDGQTGYAALPGYYQIVTLNAKLKDDPDKVNRILQMEDYFRTYIPVDQRNPQNPDYDWQQGGQGKAYNWVDGVAVPIENTTDLRPTTYVTDRYWAPNDEANEPIKMVSHAMAKNFVQSAFDTLKNTKFYINPVNRIHSPARAAKESELNKILIEYQTKMIVGQEPIANWDKMVNEYLSKGGKEVIDEVNKLLKESGISGEWN